MGICTRRNFLLTICIIQLISTIERQVFDFLGFMWAPILANFFHIIFVIFGFFGAFQYRPKYIITYSIWCLLWIGWNVFIICFYLNVGVLDKNSDVLNMGTGSVSWWEANGIGCKAVFPTNLTAEDPDPFRPVRPERVVGCLLEYEYVEILHAAFQCVLAVLGGMGGISVSHVFLEEDDSSQVNGFNKRKTSIKRTSLYSIEFSPHSDNCNMNDSIDDDDDPGLNGAASQLAAPQLSPRPMTPRRVKRRSVISRGSTGRNSLPSHHDKRSSIRHNTARSSLRSSGRRNRIQHPNPVTRLIEQQQNMQHHQGFGDSPMSSDSHRIHPFEQSSSQADLLNNTSTPQWKRPAGHTNPVYQQHSTQSLNDDEDTYNNRPSSARSSYSNYHGTRPISCYVGPGAASPYYIAGQATAQVPVKNTYRRSNHNIQKSRPNPGFFNSGPPAYQVQGIVDSETVI